MPANLTKARAAVQKLYAARDDLDAQLEVIARASPPVRITAKLADAGADRLEMTFVIESFTSASEDLKAYAAKVAHYNEAKRKARAALALKPEKCQDCLDIDVVFALMTAMLELDVNDATSELDSLSEMGELTQLRLQMLMDRKTKAISAISNVMKKISDLQHQIIQNLK